MNAIRAVIAYLHRAFASQRSTSIAWALIAVLACMLAIEYADRLPL